MSLTAAHASKGFRRTCEACRGRKARFQYRGVVAADRDHTLCFECYRAERDRLRARLAKVATPCPLPPPFGSGNRELGPAQVAHRRRMLAHLEQSRAATWTVRSGGPSRSAWCRRV